MKPPRIVFGLLLMGLPLRVAAYEALPGSVWGRLSHDVNGDVEGNTAMGFVNQGIDWITVPGKITLNTFAEYRYRLRSLNNKYFNANGPALGAELRKSFLHIGVDYYWEKFPNIPDRAEIVQYYASGFYGWDLKKLVGLAVPVKGFSGSTWNLLSYERDSIAGAGAMGDVNQGIDWVALPYGVVFNTYAEFSYRFQSKNNLYFNAYGPALGAEFRKSGFALGGGYFWQHYPLLYQNSNRMQFYLSYYIDWNLKKRSKPRPSPPDPS